MISTESPSFSVTLTISVKLFVIETWGHVLLDIIYRSDLHDDVVFLIDGLCTGSEVERSDTYSCKFVDSVRRYIYRSVAFFETRDG